MNAPGFVANTVSQHAEEVSFLWERRSSAVSSCHYDLAELLELDQRLEANIDGLQLAGNDAWDIFQELYSFDTADEVFATAVYALRTKQPNRMEFLLDTLDTQAEALPGLVSALGWCDFTSIQDRLLN